MSIFKEKLVSQYQTTKVKVRYNVDYVAARQVLFVVVFYQWFNKINPQEAPTKMDHLDLAEILSTPWLPPYGQNGDSSYVIRAALEPIIEETSDDDENGWTEMEHATWSSESETGSVIRVEIQQDQDTISERDFACPAKRRRQDEFNDDMFQLRIKPRQDFEFKFKVECCDNLDNFGKRCRLDDYSEIYSDSDSLSFNSLSRSSSLIQFESLERQLQADSQPYGGSTPALHPQSCYEIMDKTSKRLESSARNYYDVNKIDFNKSEFLTGGQKNELKRTDGSNSDSDNSDIMSAQSLPTIELPNKRINYRGKNSVENLSEDSGYCEYNSLKIRSKSIPNFGHDEFIEEEEFENHKSLENVLYGVHDETHSMNIDINSRVISENNPTKIETTKRYSVVHSSANDAKNTIDGHCIGGIASQNISTSLPDLLNHIGLDSEENNSSDHIDGPYNIKPRKSDQFLHFSIVSSVPNDLNICNDLSSTNNASSAAAKNLDLCDFETTYVPVESYRQHKVINASYSNLTILDYSGRQSFSSSIGSLKKMADNRKRNSGEFSKCNFLLDEISAHFNRDLSILNDRTENYDPIDDNFLYSERNEVIPPIPPPRKIQPTNKSNNKFTDLSLNIPQPIEVESSPVHNTQEKLTFDRDPTNLVTCYAESMERCNFDAHGSSYSINSINSNSNLESNVTPSKHSTAGQRQMVASTPNLCLHNVSEADDYFDVSSTTVSMNPLPNVQLELQDKKQGILSIGSRNSLGKGVSFCPIVSEISWREQSSEECVDDEEEFDDSMKNELCAVLWSGYLLELFLSLRSN
ncbi:hypothetical protein Bhyg_00560 [Pseudolycoriella hygida]|uniref:Uncharacterized protein n=1 Tax=Pseudolycoriella hygida TaxID=35572 RepID=A0A9Q0S6P5_9DIPT|nr:hypothetical protein Bhyg_00560 [Pseudolycoriella hygida]